jgi:hypothetical protein
MIRNLLKYLKELLITGPPYSAGNGCIVMGETESVHTVKNMIRNLLKYLKWLLITGPPYRAGNTVVVFEWVKLRVHTLLKMLS